MARRSSPFVNPKHALLPVLCLCTAAFSAELPEEKPLWPAAGFENPIRYDVKETVKPNRASRGSPSGSNRVFSLVAEPTYSIHQAAKAQATGVGLVICPGGGYRDVWLDREGHDLALWLKGRGITSLVLKYRTNNGGQGEDRIELHLFGKGGHGFDMGEGRGESAALWKESFVARLKDSGFIP